MGFPVFRFTLSNATAGSVIINEPGGWDSAVLKLERNEEYHSLVEYFDQPMLFYDQNQGYNGGLDFIKAVEQQQGPDAQVRIFVEITHDGTTYETLYDGLIDITTIKETDFYKLEAGTIRNDFWQKFINRKSIPVNLADTVDLDNNARTSFSPYTLSLPSQKIRKNFDSTSGQDITYTLVPATNYAVINFDTIVTDEVKTRFDYPFGTSSTVPNEIFTFDEPGDYFIDIHLYINDGGTYPTSSSSVTTFDAYIQYIQSGVTTTTAMTRATHGTNPTSGYTDFTYSNTLSFKAGDTLTIYFKNTSGAPNTFQWIKFFQNYLRVTADTTFTDSTTDAYKIFDAAKSIISKYVGADNRVTSTVMDTTQCYSYFSLMRGIHVRNYPMSAKPFYLSFDDWWNGANPIFNLGLGYTTSGGVDQIEICKKEDFYSSSTTLNLDNVNMIERGYDAKKIFKSIEIGYEKWQAESGSGIDDPQTKHTYNTRFKTIGEDVKYLSKFMAASLAIEQTRRNSQTVNKDWRLDEDIFIIATKRDGSATPELDENFTTVTGLFNSNTRYNIRLTPSRALYRWRKFLNGCLQTYNPTYFYFAASEGNVSMISDISNSDCDVTYSDEQASVTENQDINGGSNYGYFDKPITYTFEHPLTWAQYKAIRDNRKQAIGVSRTTSGHVPCHIMSLEYQITHGKAKFTVALAGNALT